MILKGSQRGNGRNLALHLMNARDNEHIRLHELRGFACGDLTGALKEAEAISLGTKCRQYLFSLSLSPPAEASVPESVFETTIERIEERLGLAGQPRAIVFHEKEGRRHAHCVWSRIDADTMTARPVSFFKRKLMDISRDLYLEHEWRVPPGMIDAAARDPTNFTLEEWQRAKRQGVDPRWIRQTVQSCWDRSDNSRSLAASLESHGYVLAKGDRRSFVIVDHQGEVHSLPRLLNLKTKDVRTRLGEGADLFDVAKAGQHMAERLAPTIRRHIEEARRQFKDRAAELEQRRIAMAIAQRRARRALESRQAVEWHAQAAARAALSPKGLRAIWHFITGKYGRLHAESERQAAELIKLQQRDRDALSASQLNERQPLQVDLRELRKAQALRLAALRQELKPIRDITRQRVPGPSAEQTQRRSRKYET